MAYRVTRRPDKNHSEIVAALRAHSVMVLDLAAAGNGTADIVTVYKGRTVFIELKFGKKAELKKSQLMFFSTWKGYCGIARNSSEAINLARHPDLFALKPRDQDRLAEYYATMTAKAVHLATIDKILKEAE